MCFIWLGYIIFFSELNFMLRESLGHCASVFRSLLADIVINCGGKHIVVYSNSKIAVQALGRSTTNSLTV